MIQIMLVDDHEIMREGLRKLLGSQPDLRIVAEAKDGNAALELIGTHKPDVVLMDSSMPGMSGAETTRRLKGICPTARVIGLTLYEETAYLEEMLASGADGYVLKSGASAHLVQAVRTVASGGSYFDPVVPRRTAAASHPGPGTPSEPVAELTAEELAVAQLLARGRTKAEISEELRMPLTSVDLHRTEAMRKLGVRSRAGLSRVAAQREWMNS